ARPAPAAAETLSTLLDLAVLDILPTRNTPGETSGIIEFDLDDAWPEDRGYEPVAIKPSKSPRANARAAPPPVPASVAKAAAPAVATAAPAPAPVASAPSASSAFPTLERVPTGESIMVDLSELDLDSPSAATSAPSAPQAASLPAPADLRLPPGAS